MYINQTLFCTSAIRPTNIQKFLLLNSINFLFQYLFKYFYKALFEF